MSRRVRYQVAVSLDGFIAGPNGEYDWIPPDPDIDFAKVYAQFDMAIMGRKTFQTMLQQGGDGSMPGLQVVVYSATLRQQDYPAVTVVSSSPVEHVRTLREQPGKDIWLFGGGELLHTLLESGQVDTIEPAVVPVLLGAGIPMLSPPFLRAQLTLTGHHLYPKSGIMLLQYSVAESSRP
jgi:dihydrofolate reductase